jgi:hypothetical protein
MKLLLLIEEIVTLTAKQEMLKAKFVESNMVSDKCFEEIIKMYPNSFMNQWLLTMVAKKNIKEEDVYKFKEYIDIFSKNNNKFPITDLGRIKEKNEVVDFVNAAIAIREKNVAVTGGNMEDAKNLISVNDIDRLEAIGIDLLGLVDGYQCFHVPKELRGNEEAFTVYKNILARCAGRDSGAKIDICTMANQRHFDYYLKDGPFFVFYNLSDKQSPYQFHYESMQFMDKNDNDISGRI